MVDKDWHRAFDDPIPLPNGRELVTPRDAATFHLRYCRRRRRTRPNGDTQSVTAEVHPAPAIPLPHICHKPPTFTCEPRGLST